MPDIFEMQHKKGAPLSQAYQQNLPVLVEYRTETDPETTNHYGIILRVESNALILRTRKQTELTINEEAIDQGAVIVHILPNHNDTTTDLLPARNQKTTLKNIAKVIYGYLFAYLFLFGAYSVTRYITSSHATATIVMGILAVGTSVHMAE